ncbi:MAG: tRNA lysidine(34) synthetase TilS, partial [Elusimicrobia bacterium]|nr:tRNA lysidine(34) synthetase TilS [Elusimicrobiota bacterium]
MNAWEKFKKNVEKSGLISAGDKILLAVSGGPDSVSLLHLFWRLKKNIPIELAVVHMDHGLRKSSKKELRFVENLSERFGVPSITQKLPVKKFSETNKISLETAGRNLRYDVLYETARKLRYNKIATGHTADDNAETVIMWMIRGTGTDGLGGIPASRKIRAGLEIIRPLLPITKEE